MTRLFEDSFPFVVNSWLIAVGALLGWGTVELGGGFPYGVLATALLCTGWHVVRSVRATRRTASRPGLTLVRQREPSPTPQKDG